MRKMTQDFLGTAFAGESQAHMRYLAFADAAEKEGFPNLARLFRAISYAEQVHATNHLVALGQLGSTVANLDVAIAGETFEVEEMYPAYFEVAKLQKEKEAQRSIHYALSAEKIHAELYGEAKKSVAAGSDLQIGTVYICEVCGHTVIGEPPDRCPVCGTPQARYRRF